MCKPRRMKKVSQVSKKVDGTAFFKTNLTLCDLIAHTFGCFANVCIVCNAF